METLNLHFFLWLSRGAGQQPLVDRLAIFFADMGPYLLMASLILFWFLAENQRRAALLEATEAGGLGLLLNQLLGLLYFHPRPFMLGLVDPLIKHVPENSFPSDHASLMLSVALYLLCWQSWRRQGLVLFCFAVATAWGRVYAGLHFPFDMVGSLAIAGLSVGMVRSQRRLLEPINLWLVNLYPQIVSLLKGVAGLKTEE